MAEEHAETPAVDTERLGMGLDRERCSHGAIFSHGPGRDGRYPLAETPASGG
jgi:hypothetical protein